MKVHAVTLEGTDKPMVWDGVKEYTLRGTTLTLHYFTGHTELVDLPYQYRGVYATERNKRR